MRQEVFVTCFRVHPYICMDGTVEQDGCRNLERDSHRRRSKRCVIRVGNISIRDSWMLPSWINDPSGGPFLLMVTSKDA